MPFLAEAALARVSFDRAFLGADAVTADRGICEEELEQTRLKELMIERAGAVYVLAHEEIFLLLIELLPNHRGQGLGSRLIRIVLDRAAAEGKPLVLNVLEVNRRAYELYRRLGFTEDRRFVEGPAVKIRMVAGQPE